MLFNKIIPVCSEKQRNPQIQKEELLIVEAGGAYIYHWALKG
jgi:hypothetical protein